MTADAAAKSAGDRVADRSKVDVLEYSAGCVAAERASDSLDDKAGDYLHFAPPLGSGSTGEWSFALAPVVLAFPC